MRTREFLYAKSVFLSSIDALSQVIQTHRFPRRLPQRKSDNEMRSKSHVASQRPFVETSESAALESLRYTIRNALVGLCERSERGVEDERGRRRVSF